MTHSFSLAINIGNGDHGDSEDPPGDGGIGGSVSRTTRDMLRGAAIAAAGLWLAAVTTATISRFRNG